MLYLKTEFHCNSSTFLRNFSSDNKKKPNNSVDKKNKSPKTKQHTKYTLMDQELLNITRYGDEPEYQLSEKHNIIHAQIIYHSENPDIYKPSFLLVSLMTLLLKYAYPAIKSKKIDMGPRVRFTPTYRVLKKGGYRLTTTISCAIRLTYNSSSVIPEEFVMKELYDAIKIKAEEYDGDVILGVGIKIYYDNDINKNTYENIINKDINLNRLLNNIYEKYLGINSIKASVEERLTKDCEDPERKDLYHRVDYITSRNKSVKKNAFMVGDIETLFWKSSEKEESIF